MFKPGEIVRIKSGGPDMTVSLVRGDGRVVCWWFVDKSPRSEEFDEQVLERVEKTSGIM